MKMRSNGICWNPMRPMHLGFKEREAAAEVFYRGQ